MTVCRKLPLLCAAIGAALSLSSSAVASPALAPAAFGRGHHGGASNGRKLGSAATLTTVSAAVAKPRSSHRLAPGQYTGRVGLAVSHDLFDQSTSQIAAQFNQIRNGGVAWVREDLEWGVAEPVRGQFNWAPFDRLMTAASQSGVNVLGILDYSAPWASSDPSGAGGKFYPPTRDSDFATYAAAVAARYGRGGTFWRQNPMLSPRPLAAVEIWNEPYGSWYWMPGPDPAAYAALVTATAPTVHAVDPSMTVLISGDLSSWDDRNRATGTQQQPWISRILRIAPSIARLVNGLDVHPYPVVRSSGPYNQSPRTADSFGRVALIRRAELAAGVSLPIWITEVGWSTAPRTAYSVSPQTQATFLTQAVTRSASDWGAYVPHIFLFGWYRSNGVSGEADQNCGLIEPDGTLSPAWLALTHLLGGVPGGRDLSASLSN